QPPAPAPLAAVLTLIHQLARLFAGRMMTAADAVDAFGATTRSIQHLLRGEGPGERGGCAPRLRPNRGATPPPRPCTSFAARHLHFRVPDCRRPWCAPACRQRPRASRPIWRNPSRRSDTMATASQPSSMAARRAELMRQYWNRVKGPSATVLGSIAAFFVAY